MITHEYLVKRLNYNPITGLFFWNERDVSSPQDKTWNKKFAFKETGYVRHNGYKIINLDGKEYQCSRLAWFYVKKEMPIGEIDHINCIKLDNRIENLRVSTRSENAINRKIQNNNSSGYKGVWKRKGLNSWVAQIQKNGESIKLGSFKSKEDAYRAYCEAAKTLHGEFARYE